MKKLRWDESLSAAQNARAALPELARSFFEKGRRLTAKPPSSAALHRFRLDTKALRYTLELFRPCYGPGLDRRLAVLRKIQAYLGAINDFATTTELVASSPEHAAIEAALTARARRTSLAFRRHARQLFLDPAGPRRWRAYLSRPRP